MNGPMRNIVVSGFQFPFSSYVSSHFQRIDLKTKFKSY